MAGDATHTWNDADAACVCSMVSARLCNMVSNSRIVNSKILHFTQDHELNPLVILVYVVGI